MHQGGEAGVRQMSGLPMVNAFRHSLLSDTAWEAKGKTADEKERHAELSEI